MDGTLLEAHASIKSIRPKDEGSRPAGPLAVDQHLPARAAPAHQLRPLGVRPPGLVGLPRLNCELFAGSSLYEEGAYQSRIDTHQPSAH